MNTYSFLTRDHAAHAERVFLQTESGEAYRYADLDGETARFANLLSAAGLQRGDRVAAQIDKTPQALFLYLACLRAGFCYVPLNTAYQRDELTHFIADAEPSAIFCTKEREALFRDLSSVASIHSAVDASAYDTAFDDAVLSDNDLAVILYTSGTTGRSKGAMVTHGNLCSNARSLKDLWEIDADDVLVHALPIFHIHGLFVAIHPLLLAGARIVFQPKFDATAVLKALKGATLLMGVPTFYTRLLQEPELGRDALQSMRLFVSGSAPLLRDTFDAWRERTGHTILERYGMSEAGMITSNPYRGERRAGTVGLPLPGVQLRIVEGGVEIKGPNVFVGYWRLPDKTREEFSADGWFRTGDLGELDAEGYLSIIGRAKDLIISGGYNVYPKEVELALDALPGVVESAVIGVPHADLGEAVVAVIVSTLVMEEQSLIARLKSDMAAYKCPKRIHFVAELPRNAMGKVQKNRLREQYGG